MREKKLIALHEEKILMFFTAPIFGRYHVSFGETSLPALVCEQ